MDFLNSLNNLQKKAVSHNNSHLCIIAGPGSGKTRVLTTRIIYKLLNNQDPNEILAITFTNKAADEMRDRVSRYIENLGCNTMFRLPFIGTFHSWALKFLTEINKDASDSYNIIDEDDSKEVFLEVCRENNLKTGDINRLFEKIKSIKSHYPFEFESDVIERIFASYQEKLKLLGLMDYDDLIIKAIEELEKQQNTTYFFRYDEILVDEFQDLSLSQYCLLKSILKFGARLFAIGDPHQSIYGFRGATPDIFHRITRDFQGIEVINLNISYRNPPNILEKAFNFIKYQSKSNEIISFKEKEGEISYINFANDFEEAKWIAKKIKELTGNMDLGLISGNRGKYYDFSQIAVLFRTHVTSKKLEEVISKSNIPIVKSKFYDNKIISFIKCTNYLLSLLKDKQNRFYLNQLKKIISSMISNDNSDKIINELLNLSYYDEILQLAKLFNITNDIIVKNIIKKVESQDINNLEGLPLSFKSEVDYFYSELTGVSLLTLHASKGLEFPVVFIIGIEDDILPLKNGDLDEEKRLFYVGLTRASEKLYLCTSQKRDYYVDKTLKESPFIKDLNLQSFELKIPDNKKKKVKQKRMF